MQAIIERLKTNKSPDYFGFSAQHVKSGGFVSTHYLMKYINASFQSIEYGVPVRVQENLFVSRKTSGKILYVLSLGK